MKNPITIFTGTPGVNNLVAPVRLKFDQDKGTRELAQAVNSEVDRSGRPRRRLGQTSAFATYATHSGYCNGGDAYVVADRTSDAAIYQVGTDNSLTGIASSLTKGYRISFWQVGEKTYWMNGAQSGMILAGVNYAWPTNTHVGVDSSAEFYPAPLGTHICVWRGRMWVVVGSVLYGSEPYAYGKFRLSSVYFPFPSDITMVKPTPGGLWVSDSDQVGFIAQAEKFEQLTWVKKASVPAHEWSECIMLADLSQTVFQVPGLSALWSCDEGKCYGSESGEFKIYTKDKLVYQAGGSGATVMFGDMVINSVY